MSIFPSFHRRPGTRRDGSSFTQAELMAVFRKGRIVPNLHPDIWRYDACGALINFNSYGDTTPKNYGWEVDHVYPVSRGGPTVLSNLQPLQWQNNRAKGDSVGVPYCAMRYGT